MDLSVFDSLPDDDAPKRRKMTVERKCEVIAVAVVARAWQLKKDVPVDDDLKDECTRRGLTDAVLNHIGTLCGAGQSGRHGLFLWLTGSTGAKHIRLIQQNLGKCAKRADPTEFVAWLASVGETPDSFTAWVTTLPLVSKP
jgi:hypothetical protein